MYFYTSMGCLKLSYGSEADIPAFCRDYEQERALEVNPVFFTPAVEKNDTGSKNCLNSSTYGFNGKEKDDEWTGTTGSHLNYKFREYDTRVARFFAVDPITKEYPELTPYQHSSLNPIWKIELEGLEGVPAQEIKNEKGFTIGYTPAQSSTYIPPVQSVPVQKDNIQTNIPQSTQTSIGPYNPEGYNKDFLKQQQQRKESEYKMAEFMKIASDSHPISYGGPNFGVGAVPALIEGMKQAPLIVAPELLSLKVSQLAKPLMSYGKFSKATVGMFKGPMALV